MIEKVTGINIRIPVAGVPKVGFQLALVHETEAGPVKVYERGVVLTESELALFFQAFGSQEAAFMAFLRSIGRNAPLENGN